MDPTSVTPEKIVDTIQLDGTFDEWKQKAEQEITSSEKYKEIKEKMKKLLEKSSVLKQRVSSGSLDRMQIFEQLKQEIYKSDVMKEMQQEIHNVLYGNTQVAEDIKEGTLLCVKRLSGEEEEEKFKLKEAKLEPDDSSNISKSKSTEKNEEQSPTSHKESETPTSSTVLTIHHTQSAINMSSSANFLENMPSPSPSPASTPTESNQSNLLESQNKSKEDNKNDNIQDNQEFNEKKRPREEEEEEGSKEQPPAKKFRPSEPAPDSHSTSTSVTQEEQNQQDEKGKSSPKKEHHDKEMSTLEKEKESENNIKSDISLSLLFDKGIIQEGNQVLATGKDITHIATVNAQGKLKHGSSTTTYSECKEFADAVFNNQESSPIIKLKQGENILEFKEVHDKL